MTSTTPPDPAQQPAPADGTSTSPGTPNPADAAGAPAPTNASDDQGAATPTVPKRAPRSTTPRASGTAKAPAKRPSTPRTRTTSASETSGESGDATTPAPKATTARSTTARTSTAKTTGTKSTTARTTAAKRTPAKSAAAAGGAEGTESAETTTAPKAPRSTTARPAAAKPATKAAGAKTTTARTSTTKSTTARTPAKRTPARTSAAKQTEQTAAAVAGVLDEVSAPGSVDRATTSTAPEPSSREAADRIAVDEPRLDDARTETPTNASSTAEQAADDTAPQTTPAPSESVSVAPPQEEVVAPAAAPKRPVGRPAATPPSAATSSPAATTAQRTEAADDGAHPVVLSISGLVKQFGDTVAVDGVDLEVRRGSFYGIVGPNGAGKTTTLSMVTGLLRPDAGSITVQGVDVWQDPAGAKRAIGVLPDRLRLFDRLTGSQLLYYSGVLRGLDPATVKSRTADLARAFGLDDALGRLVSDYSAGMTKKIALAAALIHSPRLLILDEPFESVDPVSAANVIEILQRYVANGGTVVLSSHGMDFIQRVCDHVAIIVQGKVLAAGSVDEVRGTGTLEERFVELAGGRKSAEGMEWLHSFSD
ncbi:ATP-binding cassette domain-containing protein [Plantibacter auratus]|uniref:ABC transporter ATP-binding protein n=1 Tax=Plantibacter auratus TaxID=272914 RepID=UPI003D33110E